MEEYSLLTKTKYREVINSVKCNNFNEAVEYFAEQKKLSIADLLRIFDVASTTTLTTEGTSRRSR